MGETDTVIELTAKQSKILVQVEKDVVQFTYFPQRADSAGDDVEGRLESLGGSENATNSARVECRALQLLTMVVESLLGNL